MSDLLKIVLVIVVILLGGYWLWSYGEKQDLALCKQKYGENYTLGHSNTNSSIKWCVSPEGVMKDL